MASIEMIAGVAASKSLIDMAGIICNYDVDGVRSLLTGFEIAVRRIDHNDPEPAQRFCKIQFDILAEIETAQKKIYPLFEKIGAVAGEAEAHLPTSGR